MSLFRKMVLLPEEEYRQLKNSKSNMNLLTQGKADTNELIKAYSDMKSALDNDSLPEDVKADNYTKSLSHFDTFKQKIEHKKLFPESQFQTKSQSSDNSPNDVQEPLNGFVQLERKIKESVPKTYKKRAGLLLSHLTQRPDVIQWNGKGEVVYKGRTLKNSNIVDLISDSIRGRSNNPPPAFKEDFLQILHEINTPTIWIGNRKRPLSSIKTYESEDNEKKTLIVPTNWISSSSI